MLVHAVSKVKKAKKVMQELMGEMVLMASVVLKVIGVSVASAVLTGLLEKMD